MSEIAHTPRPPYYVVIFTSLRRTEDAAGKEREDEDGYARTAAEMERLAALQPGYLGIESAREGLGITVSYWRDTDSILRWKQQLDHLQAQRLGRERWYSDYSVRVARVERDYHK